MSKYVRERIQADLKTTSDYVIFGKRLFIRIPDDGFDLVITAMLRSDNYVAVASVSRSGRFFFF